MKFEEVLPALREGKRIKRACWDVACLKINEWEEISISHILCDDWEIMDNIMPCPFCGKEKIRIVNFSKDNYYARCDRCDAYGPNGCTKEESISKWNAAPRKA
jgi:Lar family restriction alleviation protein